MAKRVRISKAQSSDLQKANDLLGEQTARRLLTRSGGRLIRPERYANLKAGTAKLQPWEKARLNLVTKNSGALSRLKERGEEKGPIYSARKRKLAPSTTKKATDAALKDWMLHGKQPGKMYRAQTPAQRKKQQKAIRALVFLGVDLHTDDPDYGS